MAKSDIFSGQAALKSEVFLLLIVGVAASWMMDPDGYFVWTGLTIILFIDKVWLSWFQNMIYLFAVVYAIRVNVDYIPPKLSSFYEKD